MNPLFELKKTAPLLLIALTLHCTTLLPQAQAVVPPPDGGYPGLNTAEGQNALFSLTTGIANSAFGWYSLFSNTDGSFNTALGAGTLLFNVGNQTNFEGTQNTAVGAAALLSNTSGAFNTANGALALAGNTNGRYNTAFGANALASNQTGESNNAFGESALRSNISGSFNTAIGDSAGANIRGNGNICIGEGVFGTAGENGIIRIGDTVNGFSGGEACYINGIYGKVIDPATTLAVGMDASHRLGTAVSSERFKRDIQPMGKASEAIMALKPVMFHYKSDSKNTPCFGLVAEHVAEVNPDLVIPDKEGKPYAVRYDQVNAMLLHEFQKEHRRNEEQEATIARLIGTDKRQQKQIEALTAALQKVSAQLELRKHARQVVDNE